jgi:hypothetical protein
MAKSVFGAEKYFKLGFGSRYLGKVVGGTKLDRFDGGHLEADLCGFQEARKHSIGWWRYFLPFGLKSASVNCTAL